MRAEEEPLTAPHCWLKRAAESSPDCVALASADESLSYLQLHQRVAALTQRLHSAGLQRGATLALISSSKLLSVLLIHAASRLGVRLFPIDPTLPLKSQQRLLNVVTVDALVEDLPSSLSEKCLSFTAETLLTTTSDITPPDVEPLALDDIHLLIATSGSSGEPKVVMLSGRNLTTSVAASKQRLGLVSGDCWLLCLPLNHIGGVAIVYRCCEAAASLVLHERFDPASLLVDLNRYRVTHLSLVPAMLIRLIKLAKEGNPAERLRVLLIGGDALSSAVASEVKSAGWPLCATYGMSESSSQLATDCTSEAGNLPGRVGRPLSSFEVKRDVSGTLRVRGDAVMVGYANVEQRRGDGLDDGWFTTGDFGSIGSDGQITIEGRADECLTSGGETFHPLALERELLTSPGVEAVVITGQRDSVWGDRIVAWVVGEASEESILCWSQEHLPAAMQPRVIFKVESLPLNSVGKIDRGLLRRLGATKSGE